ncbi:MAG: serine/threonine protein kinase [Myxococcales bacterium]|nr:serine/threonine protein kinase [Myxococcales bacterium]MCB9579576.1 serine/threonine protein kinase [Polyangiaceae bacterium]
MAVMAGDEALVGIASTVVALEPQAAAAERPVASRDRYQRRGVLGEGGMGRVERVLDSDLLREVAAKQLRPELRNDGRLLRQFLWEARVTAYLDHPNIVPVHDLGVSPTGHLYFTMKLVRGESLEAALEGLPSDEGALATVPRRLRVFLQLCHAVAYAHAAGVLHRDLKPANVMLGAHGEVLVTDWGLAVPLPTPAGDELRHHLPETSERSGSGTPVYMSPEQAREEPLDERSDVYALGAILYELCELRRAVDGKTLAEILVKVSTGERRPTERASAPLAAVIDKAMASDRDRRYASVSALAADVEVALDGRTPDAEAASMLTQAKRYYFSHDPAISRLRVIDVDFWVGSTFFLGMGAAIALGRFLSIHWWWPVLVGVVVAVMPTLRWLRFRRSMPRRNAP